MEKEKGEGSAHNNGAVDDEQLEDEKMEQFFALIKSFREARNRRKDELEETQKKKKIRMLNDHPDQQQQSSWVPSFEWEDFTEDIQFRRPPLVFPNPCNNEKGKQKLQKGEDDGLDLKLTL